MLRRLKAIAARAGVKHATLHKFRHTYATRLLEKDADIVTVQHLLGHSDLDTTRRYLSPEDMLKRAAVNRLSLSPKGRVGTTPTPRSGIQCQRHCISAVIQGMSSKTVVLERDSRDLPEMLTAKELERLLKIDVKTIYRYVSLGLIPYVRIESNVRFPKRLILEWIEGRIYQPGSRAKLPVAANPPFGRVRRG